MPSEAISEGLNFSTDGGLSHVACVLHTLRVYGPGWAWIITSLSLSMSPDLRGSIIAFCRSIAAIHHELCTKTNMMSMCSSLPCTPR